MHAQLRPIADQFKFNAMIVDLALGDLKNADAVRRMRKGEGSSISYMAGHLASSRYGILKMLGATDRNPYADLFGGKNGAKDGSHYPDVAELRAGWREVVKAFEQALERATESQLLGPAPDGFPIEDQTVRGAIGFLLWHECYHAGQIGMIRTELGYSSTQQLTYEAMAAAK